MYFFLTHPAPCIFKGSIDIKINLIFLFSHFFVVPTNVFFKALKKPFEAPQRSLKTRILS